MVGLQKSVIVCGQTSNAAPSLCGATGRRCKAEVLYVDAGCERVGGEGRIEAQVFKQMSITPHVQN